MGQSAGAADWPCVSRPMGCGPWFGCDPAAAAVRPRGAPLVCARSRGTRRLGSRACPPLVYGNPERRRQVIRLPRALSVSLQPDTATPRRRLGLGPCPGTSCGWPWSVAVARPTDRRSAIQVGRAVAEAIDRCTDDTRRGLSVCNL